MHRSYHQRPESWIATKEPPTHATRHQTWVPAVGCSGQWAGTLPRKVLDMQVLTSTCICGLQDLTQRAWRTVFMSPVISQIHVLA